MLTMSDSDAATESAPNEPGASDPPQHNAWWLNTRRHRPEWQSLRGAGTATFSGRPRAHYEAAKVGDPVVLYLSRPDHAIRAVGVVTQGARDEKSEIRNQKPEATADTCIEVQYAFEITNGLTWRDIQAAPSLAEAEPVRQRSSGTLFHLNEDAYRTLREMIVERNPEL